MGAVQREVCLLSVIEAPDEPVIGVMAHCAVGSEMLSVNVVLKMTVDALILRVLKASVCVAAFA